VAILISGCARKLQDTTGHIPVNELIVRLASTKFENGSGVYKCANTDNISDVHCKFKRLGARLTYGVRIVGVQVCGLRLSVGVWHFVPVSRHLTAC